MATPYLINVPPLHRWPYAKGEHKHVGIVRAHKRRVNPKKKAARKLSAQLRAVRAAKRAARRRKKATPAQLLARARFIAMVRSRQAHGAARKSTRRTGGTSMARRKRRRSAATTRRRRHRRNPMTRRTRRRRAGIVRVGRRRRHRRNPMVRGGGIVRTLVQGAQDGLAVTLGSGVTNFISSKVPFGQSTTVGKSATQLLVGTVLGPVVKKVTKSDRLAAMFVAGAYSNVIRGLLANVEPLKPFLGVYVQPTALGVYVQPRRLSGWTGGAPMPGAAMFNQVEQSNAYDDAASDAMQDFAA